MKLLAPLAAILLVASPSDPSQDDARRWATALRTFQKYAVSRDFIERSRAAVVVGEARSPKYDRKAFSLLTLLLRKELARAGSRGQSEEKVSGRVLEACLEAFRCITDPKTIDEMTRCASSRRENPRLRAYIIWALGLHGKTADLVALLDDNKVPAAQIAAADALAEKAERAWVCSILNVTGDDTLLMGLLTPLLDTLRQEKCTWEVKLVALQTVSKLGNENCVEPLIECLPKFAPGEGRLQTLCIKILERFIGVDLKSNDPNAWRAAWSLKKKGEDPSKPPEGATVTKPVTFYGVRTPSTRVVFVLDRSGSMEAAASASSRPAPKPTPPLKELSRVEKAAMEAATEIWNKYLKLDVKTRMDAARRELVFTVYALDPRVHFNVVWYESVTTPWQQGLLPATWVNKHDCLKAIDKIAPGGGTNIWDGLESAYQILPSPRYKGALMLDTKACYAANFGGADTFYVMTDGQPTAGRIVHPDLFLEELRKVTRFRKVAIHSICVGDPRRPAQMDLGTVEPADPNFVRKIAEETGGTFVHIKK